MMATWCPSLVRPTASSEPTRPHPTTMTCTRAPSVGLRAGGLGGGLVGAGDDAIRGIEDGQPAVVVADHALDHDTGPRGDPGHVLASEEHDQQSARPVH